MQHASITERRLGDIAPRIMGLAGAIGIGGIVVSLLVAAMSEGGWERFFRSYLFAFMFILSIALGALFFVMLHHAVKAGWSVTVRRLAEGVASNLMWMWVLFIPLLLATLLGWTHMYHWMHPEGDPVLEHKAPYFFWPLSYESNFPAFWVIRAVAFFAIWAVLARFFIKHSIAQDATGDLQHSRLMEKWAPLGLLLYGLTQSYAAMDWMMSLEAHWFSTMFPVYFFAASTCGFFAAMVILIYFVQRSGRLQNEITREHYQDMGKLLFAFGIVFWAYIAFSQYMLIWYANIPEETPWYLARQLGGWLGMSLLLLVGHFVGPFLALISRHPKRVLGVLAVAAGWMLLMHAVDMYWLVMPQVPHAIQYIADHTFIVNDVQMGPYAVLSKAVDDPNGPIAQLVMSLDEYKPGDLNINYGWHLFDLTLLVGMAGLLTAGTIKKLGGVSLIPERDPRLHEALAFENV